MKRQHLKSAICLIWIFLYAVGLLCMFFNAATWGIALWVLSTVAGFVTLYHIRNAEEKKAAQQKADEDHTPCE